MRRYAMILLPAALLLALTLFAAPVEAAAAVSLTLPGAPVSASHLPGERSTFEVALGGVGAGYDIVDSLVYRGWCLEPGKAENADRVTPIASDADALPSGLAAAQFDWHKVNYLLNHKQGTAMQIQQALWSLIYGEATSDYIVQAMLNDAVLNGAAYVPAPGEVMAVILYADGVEETAGNVYQETIIEVVVPGESQLAAFGDRVWYDKNEDGIQDADEAGAVGVPVSLYSCEGLLIATTSTGEDGSYRFAGLVPGDYFAQFTPLSGFLLSPQGAGDPSIDSNADVNGETPCVPLPAGESDLTWDAGIYLDAAPRAGTATASFWKNQLEAWPLSQLVAGGVAYNKAAAAALMGGLPKSDRTYQIFDALAAARLNGAIGANSGCIAATLTAADAWLAGNALGSGVKASSSAWAVAEPLLSTLDAYNNGLLCAPARDAIGAPPAEGVGETGSFLFMPVLGR